MKLLLTITIAVCALSLASARPKYIAIPVDDIQFLGSLEDQAMVRVARQTEYRPRQTQQSYRPQYVNKPVSDVESAASEGRVSRQAGHGDSHDYVDFGAHTGDHGAFGWYADFPVHAHEH